MEQVSEQTTSQNQQAEYQPEKRPLYLGLFTENDSSDEFTSYVLRCLEFIKQTYPEDKAVESTLTDLNQKKNNLQFIHDLHITSLYVGDDVNNTKKEHFRNFKEGHKQNVEIVGMIIVPDKIVTAICYPDQSVIQVDNKFPHITVMKGQWAPKFSNDVCNALFGAQGPLEKEYNAKIFISAQDFLQKIPIEISEGSATAYIVKVSPTLNSTLIAKPAYTHT